MFSHIKEVIASLNQQPAEPEDKFCGECGAPMAVSLKQASFNTKNGKKRFYRIQACSVDPTHYIYQQHLWLIYDEGDPRLDN